MCFTKLQKYIGSSPVRRLNNLNRFVVGRRFRLLSLSLYFEYKKRDAFNLPCNFFTYSFDWDSEDHLRPELSDDFQLILNSCLKAAAH